MNQIKYTTYPQSQDVLEYMVCGMACSLHLIENLYQLLLWVRYESWVVRLPLWSKRFDIYIMRNLN